MRIDNMAVTLQLASLPSINDVKPISDKDIACLEDIREALIKHDCLNRFGITLLHEHFQLADDEVLLEVCDNERRTLTITPAKKSKLIGSNVIETNWRFGAGIKAELICIGECREFGNGRHGTYHVPVDRQSP